MVEKATLPGNGQLARDGTLPESDDLRKNFIGWNGNQEVKVIGH
ncbi:MAG TPA: hypothetical protein VGC34_01625 [Steroidobacteraceae bacterium]